MAASTTAWRDLTRRLVAGGTSAAHAITTHAPPADGPQARAAEWQQWLAQQWGMGPELWNLLQDPEVTDVFINGTEVWVDRGSGCERFGWAPGTNEECRALAVRMAASAGRRLDDGSPMVDGFLGDTVRLHAVIPPLSGAEPALSLRVFRPRGFTLNDLVAGGLIDDGGAQMLDALVQRRASLLISGPTGVGKTTLLSALLSQVPHSQRLICIEEVSELRPQHPHVVHLQERIANVEAQGEVGLADLVRSALRMRPDRLILGECRGAEVREVMTALNTGHAGGFATVHANSATDIPARLVALSALAGLDSEAVASLASPAFDVVIQLGRSRSGHRVISEFGVLQTDHGRLHCGSVATRQECAEGNLIGWSPGESWGSLPEAPAFLATV